jgi:hypothetical protein
VSTAGGFVITSVPVSSLGTVGDTLSVDFNPPAVAPWTQFRIVIRSPDAQIWYGDLGTLSTAQLTPRQFNTVSFSGLGAIKNQLSAATYDDLYVEINVNGVAGDYYFDNLVFGGDADFDSTPPGSGGGTGSSTGGTSGGAPQGGGGSSTGGATGGSGASAGLNELAIRVPAGTTVQAVVLGAQSKGLDVHDGVLTLSGARDPSKTISNQKFATVTSVGSLTSTIGSGAWVGNVLSVPSVSLRSWSRVRGNITTEGSYQGQSGASYTGTLQVNANLEPFEEAVFAYQFPSTLEGVPVIQNGSHRTLSPGGYGTTTVQSTGSSLRLTGPGAFYFEDLLIESGTTWAIDNSQGAVFIVVRGKMTLRGTQTNLAPSKRNVLFAVEGQEEPDLTESFRGVLWAPHATVHLPTADVFQGAFFADELIVRPGTDYEHFPFIRDDCSSACGLMFGCEGEPAVKSCPGVVGGSCTSNDDCGEGLTCGVDNGAFYGRSRQDDVCWDVTLCESSLADSNCGGIDAACGLCAFPVLAVGCTIDSDCPGGDICRSGNGERFESSDPDVCEPSFCADSASLEDGTCGAPWSPCGLCECTPQL